MRFLLKQIYFQITAFLILFIVLSGTIGPWVISTRLLYGFGFYIYGGLGKVLLFAAIAFIILTREKLKSFSSGPLSRKNILFIIPSLLCIPLFFQLGQRLLTFPSSNENIYLTLVAHTLVVTSVLFAALAIFGIKLLKEFIKEFKKELLICILIALLFYSAFSLIFKVWYLLSNFVLICVKFLLDFTFPPVQIEAPRTLVLKDFNVTINETCSGTESLFLFSALYIIIAMTEWKNFNHHKVIGLFLPLLLGLIIVNIIRVYLIIVLGILIDPELSVTLFHTYAGMLLFILYFGLFLKVTYKWLLFKPLDYHATL